MKSADIGVGWIADGKMYFQDRFAFGFTTPIIDNTTTDWFALNGKEENGWTALQFKRKLETCDSMDVPIKFGTSTLIYAYGLEDPNPDISYHEKRRGSRTLPLLGYANPPDESKFYGLETYEFKFNNFLVPASDTTYHCKVFKAPVFKEKRHAIAHKMLIEEKNRDIVHHLLVYECDPSTVFPDDNNLPDNACDYDNALNDGSELCRTNIATIWAVGGDLIEEFPEEAGYPVGGDFSVKYYVLEMHYNNDLLISGRRDNSGIRFYVSPTLRLHDMGYLTFGSTSNALGLAIPPRTDRFNVDSYCPAKVTQSFPKDGITVITAYAHTHLQGRSVWTKLIRNGTAVQYLFNTEAFDFNYQFEHKLPKRIQLYPV
ncbi:unnamed protein product [Rotaria sp. Silwood1]|nr:unnamed protein product [Rotaria sp. Silwood1]